MKNLFTIYTPLNSFALFFLQNGVHILIATPGRLIDFVGRGIVSFNSVRFFVLDEADRMLDMGFKPDIERVLNHETMVNVVSIGIQFYCFYNIY